MSWSIYSQFSHLLELKNPKVVMGIRNTTDLKACNESDLRELANVLDLNVGIRLRFTPSNIA